MKRLCVFGLAAILCVGTVMTAAGAIEPDAEEKINQEWDVATQEHMEKVQTAKKLAYKNLESATQEEKKRILEARNTLIYDGSWAADGWTITIERADGRVEKVPEFSALFPGWEKPEFESCEPLDRSAQIVPLREK